MVPIKYDESKLSWETMTNVIIHSTGDDARLFKEQCTNFNKYGFTDTQHHGYQYLIGKNFPFIFKDIIS